MHHHVPRQRHATGENEPLEDAMPMAPAEFTAAFATALGSLVDGVVQTSEARSLPIGEALKRADATAKDTPLNRVALTMGLRFHKEPRKYVSFMLRFMALQELVASGALGKPGSTACFAMDPAAQAHLDAITVASWFPLTRQGTFDHAAFLKALGRTGGTAQSPNQ